MDLGVVGCFSGSGVVSSDNTSSVFASTVTATSDAASAETKQKLYGSGGFFKQIRSFETVTEEDKDLRDTKVAKTGYSSSNPISEKQQMLSFSSPNCSESVTMPYYHHHIQDSNGFTRNSSGYGSWGLNGGSMDGVLTGIRGSFTASQWMELEHQALIYKYITANVPIPTYLLNPIKKALESAGFSSFLGLRSNALEWGAFQIGFSNTSDPEPGRCRRTDGKKWRCSRDAVADHKYCERHMNRGRHRSRKPVEGQTGHSVSGTTTTAAAKLMTFSSSTSAALVPGGAASNSLALSHHRQLNNLQPAATNPSSKSPYLERSLMGKENVGERYTGTKGLSIVSPSVKESQSSIYKEQNPCDEAFRSAFGLVCADSSVKPLNKSTSFVNNQSYGNSHDISDRERKLQHPLRRFMDDQSTISWPDIETNKFNLSISIPMVTSDFMSSTSSPTNEKLADSPPELSRELEATRMGLGMGTNMISDQNQRQGNWNPITWESSMGGPLGEVLNSTNSSSGDCNGSSALNLMTEAWNRSPRMESSPTGVLQKVSFGSVSNSSAGSSPRTHESSNLCNVLFGTTLMNPTL